MKNNFDLLRLIFAVFVVITHSYILSGNPNDFFWQMTKQTTLSYIGVAGFFVISGYLIFKSFERSKNISDFFEKRIRRIFPGLIIAQLVTLIAISILIKEEIFFLFQKETILYFVKGCTIFLQKFRISGLFENNLHPQVINGSLWTIPFEFFLYIFMAVFFTIFKFKDNLFSILLLLVILLSNFLFYDRNILQGILPESLNYNLKNLAHFGVFFFSGVLFAKYQIINLKNSKVILITSLLLSFILFFSKSWELFHQILIPFLIISAGILHWEPGEKFIKKIGDCSYGIYIYSFPLQQILMNLFPSLDQKKLISISLPISILLGFLSWRFVEKKFLKRSSKL